MINLTIDGKSIQAEPGSSVMEAALENGIDIPRLCYHPELSVSGGCRLCIGQDLLHPINGCVVVAAVWDQDQHYIVHESANLKTSTEQAKQCQLVTVCGQS